MTSEINRIKTNLQKLKDAYYVMQSTPDVPSTDRLSINYVEANNIEKIMVDIDIIITRMIESFYKYSGTFYSGE